jgi:hypothetical protein
MFQNTNGKFQLKIRNTFTFKLHRCLQGLIFNPILFNGKTVKPGEKIILIFNLCYNKLELLLFTVVPYNSCVLFRRPFVIITTF